MIKDKVLRKSLKNLFCFKTVCLWLVDHSYVTYVPAIKTLC